MGRLSCLEKASAATLAVFYRPPIHSQSLFLPDLSEICTHRCHAMPCCDATSEEIVSRPSHGLPLTAWRALGHGARWSARMQPEHTLPVGRNLTHRPGTTLILEWPTIHSIRPTRTAAGSHGYSTCFTMVCYMHLIWCTPDVNRPFLSCR